jgi:hypothetical protein
MDATTSRRVRDTAAALLGREGGRASQLNSVIARRMMTMML